MPERNGQVVRRLLSVRRLSGCPVLERAQQNRRARADGGGRRASPRIAQRGRGCLSEGPGISDREPSWMFESVMQCGLQHSARVATAKRLTRSSKAEVMHHCPCNQLSVGLNDGRIIATHNGAIEVAGLPRRSEGDHARGA